MRSILIKLAVVPIILALQVFCAAIAFSGPASAQGTPGLPEQPSPPAVDVSELKALAETLEDEGRRNALVSQLRALIAAKEKIAEAEQPLNLGDRLLDYAAGTAAYAQEAIGDVRGYFGDWPAFLDRLRQELGDPAGRSRGLQEALAFAGIFIAGWVAELVLRRLLTGSRRRLDAAAERRGIARLPPVAARFLLDLFPLVAFAAAAYGAAVMLEPTAKVRTVGLHFVNAYLIASGLMVAARLLLAPTSRALRLLPLSDVTAHGLYVWCRRFVNLGVFGYFVIAAVFLLGLPRRGAEALFTGLGLIFAGLAIVFVLRHRRKVSQWLRRRAASASQRLGTAQLLSGLAVVWHLPAIAYIVGFFIVAAFRIEGGFAFMFRATLLSLLVLAGAWLLLLGLRRLLKTIGDASKRAPETSSFHRRASAYLPVVAGGLRLVVLICAVLLLLQVWSIDAWSLLQRPWGQRAVSAILSIGMVLVFAIVFWELASNAIARYLERSSSGESSVQHSARIRTLLPLLRKALFVFLLIMVVMITLSELGVNIAPLLAGAGVVGLAIGFGAQKLVQDVITGIFMLVEDALAVGDVVNVAGIGGLVEDMSIRSIRLRDLSGNVHTVPFSSVGTVTNMTKVFSYYLLDIGVSYREDTDKVAQVCKDIVEEMRSESEFAADILEPLEVLGLDQFVDSAVIIKARIKTRPIKQWGVGREFNRRMKKRFDKLGIEFPFPHRTIQLDVDKRGEAPPLHELAADAAAPPPPPPQPPPAATQPAAKPEASITPAPKRHTAEETPAAKTSLLPDPSAPSS
jgi:small conductance mechanosensitive channel